MSTKLKFLGVAGFEIAWPGRRILIDPYFIDHPAAPVQPDEVRTPDVILVTHAAWDHYGETASIAKRTGAPVVCGGEVRAMLLDQGLPSEQIRATTWGIVVEVGGVVIRPVECHHWSQGRLSDGTYVTGMPMGFIVETEPGIRIYHYGDTAIFSDMRLIARLYRPTVGLLGCSQPQELLPQVPGPGRILTGEMTPDEAALAAEFLGLRVAIACHYYDVSHPDVQQFLELVPKHDTTGTRQAIAPRVGETLTLETNDGGDTIRVHRPHPASRSRSER